MVALEQYRRMAAALAKAGIEDADYEADLMFRHITGRSRLTFSPEEPLAPKMQAALQQLCDDRCTRHPLQYLLGEWGFYNVVLKVGEGVLIPRADTETVVEKALELIAPCKAPRVLDLCAGSGAIGIAIKHERKDAQVTCVELSPKALYYLRQNAAPEEVDVVEADVLGYENQLLDAHYDLIISNPPYVTDAEYAALAPELAYEPKMALVAAQEGLRFYEYITKAYAPKLAEGGWLCFEIGALQRTDVCGFFEKNGYTEIQSIQDYAALDRCVFGRKRNVSAKMKL